MSEEIWIPFLESKARCHGLPWLQENLPEFGRLPKRSKESLPPRVWRLSQFANDARIRLRSTTSKLLLRLRVAGEAGGGGMDVYVNGQFWRSAPLKGGDEAEVSCFAGGSREMKDVEIYFPPHSAVQVMALGVDSDAGVAEPFPFALEKPFVLYGSSIAQGVGAARGGMSYASILGRMMNVDHVNLGFSGAGKAEPSVVRLVSEIDACCYILDLGKSYGRQSSEPYVDMLTSLRKAHPGVPIICITPIFSSREFFSPDYADLSNHTRAVVREAVTAHIAAGDNGVTLVEGQDLLSCRDTDGLSGDGLHPGDLGFSLIAERLYPVLTTVLSLS